MMKSILPILLLMLFASVVVSAKESNAEVFKAICEAAGDGFRFVRTGKESPPTGYLALVKKLESQDGAMRFLKTVARGKPSTKSHLAKLVLYRLNNPDLAKQFDPFHTPDLIVWKFYRTTVRPQVKPFPPGMLSAETQKFAKQHEELYSNFSKLAAIAYKRAKSQGLSPTYRLWLRGEVDKLTEPVAEAFKKDQGEDDTAIDADVVPSEVRELVTRIAFATQLEHNSGTEALESYHDYRFYVNKRFQPFLCEAAIFSREPVVKGQFARLASLHDTDPFFFRLLAIQYLGMTLARRGELRISQQSFISYVMNGIYLHPDMENLKTVSVLVSRAKGKTGVTDQFKLIPHYERQGIPARGLRKEWNDLLKKMANDPKMKKTYAALEKAKRRMWVFSGDDSTDLPR